MSLVNSRKYYIHVGLLDLYIILIIQSIYGSINITHTTHTGFIRFRFRDRASYDGGMWRKFNMHQVKVLINTVASYCTMAGKMGSSYCRAIKKLPENVLNVQRFSIIWLVNKNANKSVVQSCAAQFRNVDTSSVKHLDGLTKDVDI